MSSAVEFPLSTVTLVVSFSVAALYMVTNYVVATWTSAALFALLVAFALWKFRIMPHVSFLFPILIVALLAGIAADVGFRYTDGQNEIPGATIVAVCALALVAFTWSRGWV
jgi:hypothetical protein